MRKLIIILFFINYFTMTFRTLPSSDLTMFSPC